MNENEHSDNATNENENVTNEMNENVTNEHSDKNTEVRIGVIALTINGDEN